MTTLTDAARRTIRQGDNVGGTTSGRYQTTITGPVLQIGKDRAQVLVTNRPTYGDVTRAANGDTVWISAERLFLIHPASQREFVGFRTPDGRVWNQAARVKGILWETPMVHQRYDAPALREMYAADLQPWWHTLTEPTDGIVCDAEGHAIPHSQGCPQGPAALPPHVIRAEAFREAAARLLDLPQDYELDPGRGDALQLLERLAADTYAGIYPPALHWALLMDDDDLIAFLNEVAGVMQDAGHMDTQAGHVHARRILDGLEAACGTWRVIAEAQHAHNTAPGPAA